MREGNFTLRKNGKATKQKIMENKGQGRREAKQRQERRSSECGKGGGYKILVNLI